jgi:hypothetical protein
MRHAARIAVAGLLAAAAAATGVMWIVNSYKPLGWHSDIATARSFFVNVRIYENALRVEWFLVKRAYQDKIHDSWEIESAGFAIQYYGTYCPADALPLRPPRYAFQVPLWFLVLLFSAYPVFALTRLALGRRHPPPGHCQNRGYDLTGNVSGRCPECGQPM